MSEAVTLPSGRTYLYRLPGGVNPTSPAPVVLVLHALGIDAASMEDVTGLSDLADSAGFVAVYPNANVGPNPFAGAFFPERLPYWNAGPQFSAAGTDDVAFLSKQVLDTDLPKRANVDRKRTYVVGMSNGGMMAYRLAAELSDRFAAMAAVSGALLSPRFEPSVAAMPVLHVHGTADQIVPYAGVDATMAACAAYNGCNPTPSVVALPPAGVPLAVEKVDYGKGTSGAEVVLYRVVGGGHTWPQQRKPVVFQARLGPITPNLDANRTIWEFFQKYHRP
jgi:polyhydroxybutyrate depolymerase